MKRPSPYKPILRLRKKHAPSTQAPPTADDGARLVAAQSLGYASIAAIVVIVLFAMLWASLSVAFGRVFPWMTLLLGVLVGLAVRRGGHGLTWRFPLLAAALALTGSIVANVVVAAAYTAGEFDTGTLTILTHVTTMTWPVFFAEVMTAADLVFAFTSAGLAAYYANRRLNRREFRALRLWQEQKR